MNDFFTLHKKWMRQPFSWKVLNSELFGLLLVDFLAQHIPPGDILDCGCNIGHLAIHFGTITNLWNKQIVAIDPNGTYRDIVLAGFQSYAIERGTFIEAAITDFNGKGHFQACARSEQESQLVSADKTDIHAPDVSVVECMTIDHICKTHGLKPTVIKLDVERGEVQALIGARETLNEYRPVILFEWGQNTNNAEDSEKVFEIFEKLDYIITDHFGFIYDRDLWAEHRTREVPWNRYAYPREYAHLHDFIRKSFQAVHAIYGFNYEI